MLNVGWWSETTPPAQILSQISGTMGRCHELESFSFVMPDHCFFHGDPSVNFKEIFGPASTLPRDMKLASLELRGVTVAASEFLRHIRHFRYLTKLHITFDPSSLAATNIGEILHLLAKDRIYLKDISSITRESLTISLPIPGLNAYHCDHYMRRTTRRNFCAGFSCLFYPHIPTPCGGCT
jgi:hypothetical protein